MKWTMALATLVVGALIPIQALLNSKMGKLTGGPVMGALVSFTVGLVCLLSLVMVSQPYTFRQLGNIGQAPWYAWLGGVIGAIFVGYITWANQKLGVGFTFALVVTGQLVASLVLDHYGWLGAPLRQITLEKIIGVILIIAGVVLVKK
ncbi:DMT family transporter [Flavihumibacter rivuli]|uniref:DMT family transporter n=1 Tax=Flavihumibacter rivuli TaxID=2838156 RepID=UPI001BDF0BF3|nr:DMT family transporter [Flavihumibacter rivuli]ULQ56411.1 DMT family transporter [Flavihumibacter rivuli]